MRDHTTRLLPKSKLILAAGLLGMLPGTACGDRQGPPSRSLDQTGGNASTGGSSASTGGSSASTGGASASGGDSSSLGGAPGSGGREQVSCPTFGEGAPRTRPIGPLGEASGLTSSRLVDGRLFSHNDSGGEAQAFALDDQGVLEAIVDIDVPFPTDWEDMAAFVDDSGTAKLVFGDIGDNAANRESVNFVITEEKADLTDATPWPAQQMFLTYEDGSYNAEALFVDERSQHAYVLTKAAPPRVYRVDLNSSDSSLSFVGVPANWPEGFVPTAADLRDGELVVRSLTSARLYLVPGDTSVIFALSSDGCAVTLATEESAGEAIALDGAGNLFTLTESADPLTFFERL